MKAKSIKGKSLEEIKEKLDSIMGEEFQPTLALVFLSISHDRTAVSNLFDDLGIEVFGATTNGEFIDDETEKGSIVAMLLDIDPSNFTILFEEFPNKNYREITRSMAKRSLEKFSHPCFLISGSNMETDAEELLLGFADVVGEDVNVYGGMAGDDYSFKDQYVFTINGSSDRGIVALVLDEEKIKIRGVATCGWKAVGTEKTVTKSEGNHVYTVDDVPVLELTKKYGGLDDLIPGNDMQVIEIATNFPIQLQRERGDPVMRPGLLIDWNDGSFYCSGTVPQGSKVRFSLPPDFDVMDKVIKGVQKLKDTEMPEADAVIIFSCAGRILSLGPLMNQEIEGVKNVWNAPMVGFFSNAELGRATNGGLEMHNLSTICIALKEKE
jgi:hypothetical protein